MKVQRHAETQKQFSPGAQAHAENQKGHTQAPCTVAQGLLRERAFSRNTEGNGGSQALRGIFEGMGKIIGG